MAASFRESFLPKPGLQTGITTHPVRRLADIRLSPPVLRKDHAVQTPNSAKI
jgi:hypothetical protein